MEILDDEMKWLCEEISNYESIMANIGILKNLPNNRIYDGIEKTVKKKYEEYNELHNALFLIRNENINFGIDYVGKKKRT